MTLSFVGTDGGQRAARIEWSWNRHGSRMTVRFGPPKVARRGQPSMHDPRRPDHWSAAEYAQHSSLQEAMASRALALIDLRGDEHVLDIGCGDGRLSARIATQLVPQGMVCGVDASADMIGFAQRQHADVANLHFMVVDARQMHFDGSFDAAVSFNALHWVPELLPALRGLRAALVPDGRAWLRLVTQGPVTSIETIAEQVRRDAAWAPLFVDFDDPYLRLEPEQVATLALSAGLGVLALHTRLESWDFGSRAALVGFCGAGFGAWTRALPAEQRDGFIDAVIDRYLASRDDVMQTVFRFYQTDLALTVA
jgi:trans-aconitate 2-methyltransferase